MDTCLDALALSRELGLGGGLHGGKLSASAQELAYRPCAAAVEQLARLWEGLPSFSSLLREESVFHQLLADYPGAVSAMEYHRELAALDAQRLQAAMLVALVQVDIARAEQGRWPATLPDGTAMQLRLEVLSDQEARLIPADAALEDHALRLTADTTE